MMEQYWNGRIERIEAIVHELFCELDDVKPLNPILKKLHQSLLSEMRDETVSHYMWFGGHSFRKHFDGKLWLYGPDMDGFEMTEKQTKEFEKLVEKFFLENM